MEDGRSRGGHRAPPRHTGPHHHRAHAHPQTYQASAKQIEWAADLAVQNALTITRLATYNGTDDIRTTNPNLSIQFVDPSTAFLNHDVCSLTNTPWVNGLLPPSLNGNGTPSPIGGGSFHPNATGQAQFAALINSALAG